MSESTFCYKHFSIARPVSLFFKSNHSAGTFMGVYYVHTNK